ncbi:MAG TPA: anaerobic ribonucleoside-triphosphate reductase [Bacteroidales bacterium]|nr:anaerobic ribonucleoside-triphosphate reductase [Bacteroidales bacterium]
MTPIKVKRSSKSKVNSTNIQMMVESSTEEKYDIFDKGFIINSLVKEVELDIESAMKIADDVEKFLLKNELLSVNSSFIRTIVNYFLSKIDNNKYLKYNSLSIPIYNIKQIIEEANKENSNTAFSPESVNLTIAGQILKQYALREVFDKDISDAHVKGDIHLHDLDFINRPYAFDGDNNEIEIKHKITGNTYKIGFNDLYYLFNYNDYQIYDKYEWVDIISIIQINENKDIYEIKTDSNNYLYVTEDHPCLKYINDVDYEEIQTKDLKINDLFYINNHGTSKIVNIEKIKTAETVYDITTSSHTLMVNNIHVHNCSGNSIEYIKKYGLKLPNVSQSDPAKHAQTLVNHIQCFANYLQGLFAGAIGFECVNMFFAPLLEDMEYEEVKQIAQHLVFSFAQLAGNRGGQVVFSDFNMYLKVPEHYKNTPAIGAGGKYTGKNYGEYEYEMRNFLHAIFEVIMNGDSNKANFPFPKILLHINKDSFDDALLDMACEINSKRGSVYILYDRGQDVKISQCCRLSINLTKEETERLIKSPEEMRFSAWQNITINLPRIGYKYKDINKIKHEIDRLVDTCMRGHKIKYDYICNLLDKGENGCLGFLTKGFDGKPYLRKEEAKFLIGMIGLNELVKIITDFELHESEEALIFGLEIISYLYQSVNNHAKVYNLQVMLEETPAEGLSLRAALLDLKQFEEAKKYVKGNIESGEVYYTNSIHLAYNANVDILTRIEKQSKFAPMIKAGAIIHNWFGESEPDPKALKQLYKTVLEKTNAVQTADSPDFTVCRSCKKSFKGLKDKCIYCNSDNVYQTTRITGYFSQISGWTKSKLAELKDRLRVNITDTKTFINNDEEKILFFSKPNCSKCDDLKKILKEKNIEIPSISTEDYKGLALANYYNIDELPCLLKVKGPQIISKISGSGSYLKWLKENK